jgi:hypothetical protein
MMTLEASSSSSSSSLSLFNTNMVTPTGVIGVPTGVIGVPTGVIGVSSGVGLAVPKSSSIDVTLTAFAIQSPRMIMTNVSAVANLNSAVSSNTSAMPTTIQPTTSNNQQIDTATKRPRVAWGQGNVVVVTS